MRIAILSDTHSNLEALEKALSILSKIQIDEIVFLGDIVGYGANPKECVKKIKENSKYIILGNHDEVASNLSNIQYFNQYAAEAAIWTHNRLNEHEKEFLKNLPLTLELENIQFVHSSPYKPENWSYILNKYDALYNFKFMKNNLCFIGHSHIADIFSSDKKDKILTPEIVKGNDYIINKYNLNQNKKYIINVGSVGQPRDLDWRLSFGIFDTLNWTYENIRAEYDVKIAAMKIYQSTLPRYLADRLLLGK